MFPFRCFSILIGRRKNKDKVNEQSLTGGPKTLPVNVERPRKRSETDELKPATFDVAVPCGIQKNSRGNVRVMSLESPVNAEAEEAYEGGDEYENSPMIKRELSDFDLQGHQAGASEEGYDPGDKEITSPNFYETQYNDQFEDTGKRDRGNNADMIKSGHLSDPGIDKTVFWASPKLERSCSNLERRDVLRERIHQLPTSKSQSYEDLQELSANQMVNLASPRSVMTHCSADRVMLKKHSSSQVLPSGSRKLWWKFFLWSHRNIHTVQDSKSTQLLPAHVSTNKKCGYSSDTIEPKQGKGLRNVESVGSFTEECFNNCLIDENVDNQRPGRFQNEDFVLWPQNQWVAFSTESSSLTRVDEWVRDLETQQSLPVDDDDDYDNAGSISFPPSPDAGRSMARSTSQMVRHPNGNLSMEILNTNSIVLSLHPTSTAAHISGFGLKAIPAISHFCSLRSVNLSNNFIVQIPTGVLPKGIHTLNLSKNKINTIEGLRELTRLRVLDLCYNRISRIGQGLSNCTIIKELYLAGNKISDVEGLHRLLKLTVVDLSFNKITTTKALGQLVANYNSLQALNLLGNPIHSNISDDQLRKALCGLLPKLVYLNKQPIKPQRAREVLTDSVAKAALGNSNRSSHRRATKRASQGGSVSSSGHRSSVHGQKSRNRSGNRTHTHQWPVKGTTR